MVNENLQQFISWAVVCIVTAILAITGNSYPVFVTAFLAAIATISGLKAWRFFTEWQEEEEMR